MAKQPSVDQMRQALAAKGGFAMKGTQKVLPAVERDANLAKFLEGSAIKERVYHGTMNDVSKFSDRKLGQNTDANASSKGYAETARVGHWFNTQPMGQSPEKYGAGYSVDMPVHLSIKNPKREMNLDWLAQGLESKKGRTYRRELEKQGYDGLVLPDEEFGGESWVAFRPKQIKSAIGNRGTYDPTNPDITMAQGGTVKPFDYENPEHVENVANIAAKYRDFNKIPDVAKHLAQFISQGSYKSIEDPRIQMAIKKAGYDGYHVNVKNSKQIMRMAGGGGVKKKTYNSKDFLGVTKANNASSSQQTQAGLKALYDAGYSPDEAASLWNESYGTNFTGADYSRELNNAGIERSGKARLAVFGDSISSAVGYKPDGKGYGDVDTSYGQSLAQVLGHNLKINTANNTRGGATSQESVRGAAGQPFDYGNFAKYITENKPSSALLRFGAADAILMDDPATSLKNIENMVQISRQNGTKPILVGVTPFAKSGDINSGGIADKYVTDKMISNANAINKGIQELSKKYNAQFVDVRKVPVPPGGLLDGVHPSGEYGLAMDQYISDQIKDDPVLSSSADDKSIAQMKAEMMNQNSVTMKPYDYKAPQNGTMEKIPGVAGDPEKEGKVILFWDHANKRVVISDEGYWNPFSPVGEELKIAVDWAHAQGYQAGVVLVPYASDRFPDADRTAIAAKPAKAATDDELRAYMDAADFVVADPYLIDKYTASPEMQDKFSDFTKFVGDYSNSKGKDTWLVLQGFAVNGVDRQTAQDYNDRLTNENANRYQYVSFYEPEELQNDKTNVERPDLEKTFQLAQHNYDQKFIGNPYSLMYNPLFDKIDPSTFTGTAQDKANRYNDYLKGGASDMQIRQAVESAGGVQSNADWMYLQNLASTPVAPAPTAQIASPLTTANLPPVTTDTTTALGSSPPADTSNAVVAPLNSLDTTTPPVAPVIAPLTATNTPPAAPPVVPPVVPPVAPTTAAAPDYSRAYAALGGADAVNNMRNQFVGMGLNEDAIGSVFSKYYKRGGVVRKADGGGINSYNYNVKQNTRIEDIPGVGLTKTFWDEPNKRIVVSDEGYWNPKSPTGDKLKLAVQWAHDQGYKAGVAVTPYASDRFGDGVTTTAGDHKRLMPGATDQQLMDYVDAADFVVTDPYVVSQATATSQTLNDFANFTKNVGDYANQTNKDSWLVLQGFSPKELDNKFIEDYNNRLTSENAGRYKDVSYFNMSDFDTDEDSSGFNQINTQGAVSTPPVQPPVQLPVYGLQDNIGALNTPPPASPSLDASSTATNLLTTPPATSGVAAPLTAMSTPPVTNSITEMTPPNIVPPVMARGGIVRKAMGGSIGPSINQMRSELMNNQFKGLSQLQSIGANEAPNMGIKAYVPTVGRPDNGEMPVGGVDTSKGDLPIGGIDMSQQQVGQQLMPNAPPAGQQPGMNQVPMGDKPPMGGAPQMGGMPPPQGGSNILSMTPQGQAMAAIKPPGQPMPGMKPQGLAKGGQPSVDQMKAELASKNDASQEKRVTVPASGAGGVKGIVVPKHLIEGNPKAGAEGLKNMMDARAKVYGEEHREPLNLGQMGKIHKQTLEEHFAKPLAEQKSAEQEALNKIRSAKFIKHNKDTLDESEKLDTVEHEHDEQGRSHVGYASKGIAGHALFPKGHGDNMDYKVINTCPGQTEGCGGGKSAEGIVDTKQGTCFAPNAESQYAAAVSRRAGHAIAKHDPAMTRDWIIAHTGSMRNAAGRADKQNKRMLYRPNVVDETDVSSRHVIRHLNDQRKMDDKPPIIANSYGKTNELHDPENGYHVTHSNVGPKVKKGQEVSENVARDKARVRNTVMAADNQGDFKNEQGNKTPPKGSYMVTDVKRGSPMAKKMEGAITHAKYWTTGRPESELSHEEREEGPEGHYSGTGRKTSEDQAHYGHTTHEGLRYDYQKQHVLHPRLVQVGKNDDGTPHIIPTDSRFKDEEFLPKNRFKTKNGKNAGHILMTTPTESTSNIGHQTSFTHNVSDKHIEHAENNSGEYEIDKPEDQAKAKGKEYAAPQAIQFRPKPKTYAMGGSVGGRHIGFSDDDFHAFPEQNVVAQRHLAMRGNDHEAVAKHGMLDHKRKVTINKDLDTMLLELTRNKKAK